MDGNKIAALLNMAAHDGTNHHLALGSIKKVYEILAREGKDFSSLMSPTPGQFSVSATSPPPIASAWNTVSRHRALEEENRELSAELSAARAKIHRLENAVTKPRQAGDGLSYDAFQARAKRLNGNKLHGMKSSFSRHMGFENTVEIDKWERQGQVPPEALEKLKTFTGEARAEEKSRGNWTHELDLIVMDVLKTNTELQTVGIVNEMHARGEFPFRVQFGSVKKVRQRARFNELAQTFYDEGVRDAEALFARIEAILPTGSGGRSLASVKKFLERVESSS